MRWTLWLLALFGIAQFAWIGTDHTDISLDMAYLVMALCFIVAVAGLAFAGCWEGCANCAWGGCGCGHCAGCQGDDCCGQCACVTGTHPRAATGTAPTGPVH